MVDMSINFAGVELKNPMWLANGHISQTVEQMKKAIDAGVSVVDVKTSSDEPEGQIYPRALPGFLDKYEMPQNYSFGLIALLPLEKHVKLIREIKPIAEKEDVKVLGSYGMLPADGIAGFVKAAQAIEEAGADLFKFAVAGCPLIEATKSEEERQAELKLYYESLNELCTAIKEGVSIPVGLKLISRDMVDLLNGLNSSARSVDWLEIQGDYSGWVIDVEAGRPVFPTMSQWGRASKNLSVNMAHFTYNYLKSNNLDIPIMSTGGIWTWRDSIERMMVGATCFNMHTAVEYRGYKLYTEVLDGMKKFLERKEYEKASNIIAVATPYMDDPEEIEKWFVEYVVPPEKVLITVDPKKCNGCGRCEVCVSDGIRVEEDLAKVDLAKCDRCGLCASLCPSDAITLKIVK